jgi:hypothetical protein
MAVWVVPIGHDRPENWGLGRDSLLWATPAHQKIEAGDSLLFYQAVGRGEPGLMVGRAVAASAAESVTDRESLPWKDGVDYRWRYQLDSVEDADPPLEIRWARVQDFLGQRGAPQAPRQQRPDFVPVPELVEFLGEIRYPSRSDTGRPTRPRRPRATTNQRTGVRRPFDGADEHTSESPSDDETVVQVRTTRSATNRHNATLNKLARFIAASDGTDLEYEGQSFGPDLIWQVGGVPHVAEVKSLDGFNQFAQLRLGLGQVLQYRHREGPGTVAWLAVEFEPEASTEWVEVCASADVRLWWPGKD